jgi:uncharacterized protein (TIGR02145 family)
VFSIGYSTATVSYNIDNNTAVKNAGVVWDTKSTFDKNSHYVSGSIDDGEHTINLTSMPTGSTIYFRAYVDDGFLNWEDWSNTLFGEVKTFKTLQQETGTFTDARDNVTYKWVKIGNQVWMAENLRATKYNDGTYISNITNQTTWNNLTSGAYCYYDNSSSYSTTYGCLYNWYAVNTGKLAPTGWHVPTDAEWTTLSDYLGGEDIAGGHLKSTTGWDSPNTNADNSSGFSALPGGCRTSSGFYSEGLGGTWWSSTETSSVYAWVWSLLYYYGNLYGSSYGLKFSGYSVRCVRDN